MKKNIEIIKKGGLLLLLIIMAFEVVRSSMRDGDFIGYIRAGRLTLDGAFIYSDYLNTWPPFFSVFCVPFAWLDQLNGTILRGCWTALMIVAFFYCMRISLQWLTNQKLCWPFQSAGVGELSFTSPIVLIPFLILFRFVLDNQTNLQINIFLLLACLLCIKYWSQEKILPASFLLALAIAVKAYPIFLLFFFLFKLQFRLVAWAILMLLIINGIPFLVYGLEDASTYYAHWWNEIASPYPESNHKNQSFNALLRNYLHTDSQKLMVYFNFLDLELSTLKKLGYAIIGVVALYPMYIFGFKMDKKMDINAQLEFAFVFAAICILSPVAWKSNFIFLYPAYLLIYYWVFIKKEALHRPIREGIKVLFFASLFLNIFSSELFIGNYFSDVLESFSCITFGTIFVLIAVVMIYRNKSDLA